MENEQNQNMNTQPMPEQPVVQPEKSSLMSSKWLKIGIAFVVIILVLSFTFVLGKNSSNPKISETTQTSTLKSSPTPTPDLTADWKTATTTTYSLKYPSNWYLESKTATYLRIQNYNPIGAPGREYDPNQDKGWFSIQISKVDKTANNINDLKTVIQNLDAESIAAGFTKSSTTDKVINNNGIVGISRIPITDPTEPPTVYLLDGKGNIYFVGPGLDLSAGKNYFNDILNTFKFTDSSSSTYTSTWKTYNGVYVSFRYPSSWNPTKKDLWGGEILEGVSLNILGATDNQIGFSDVDYSSLQKPQDIVQESEVLIGGRNGVKYIRKGDNYFTYDYLTYGENDKSKSFGINVTVSKEDKNLENQLDQLISSIKFTQ